MKVGFVLTFFYSNYRAFIGSIKFSISFIFVTCVAVMLNSSKPLEKFLQRRRFKKVLHFLKGDVLDFGGNEGELRSFVKGSYFLVNYDHSVIENKMFDTIVSLAVIEHLSIKEVTEVFRIFKSCLRSEGHILITTPSIRAKLVLKFLAFSGLLDKNNLAEHKHYWSKEDIFCLADKTGFIVDKYQNFQFGFNQYIVLSHKK